MGVLLVRLAEIARRCGISLEQARALAPAYAPVIRDRIPWDAAEMMEEDLRRARRGSQTESDAQRSCASQDTSDAQGVSASQEKSDAQSGSASQGKSDAQKMRASQAPRDAQCGNANHRPRSKRGGASAKVRAARTVRAAAELMPILRARYDDYVRRLEREIESLRRQISALERR